MKNKVFKFLGSLRYTHFIFLTLAGVINAAGVTLLLAPAGMYDGGFSGTSILLSQVTPLSMSVFLLLLNVPFFLFGHSQMEGDTQIHFLYGLCRFMESGTDQVAFDKQIQSGIIK